MGRRRNNTKMVKPDEDRFHLGNGEPLYCRKCGKPIKWGDDVVEVTINVRMGMNNPKIKKEMEKYKDPYSCHDFDHDQYGYSEFHKECIPDIVKYKGYDWIGGKD